MNFQAVDSANGNNIKIWATMTEHLGVTQKDGKLKLKCKLRDDDGVTHNAHIHKGKGELPGVEHLNQRMEFNLSTFQGTYQDAIYTGYSGFWSHGTTAPQSAQQASPQPAQRTNAPQTGSIDVELRKSVVCAYIAAGAAGAQMLVEEIEYWMEYIKTGIDKSLPDNRPMENQPEGEQRPAQDQEIPW